MSRISLARKNIVITGASQGIGAAICRQLAREGANISLIARNLRVIKTLVEELKANHPGGSFTGYSADVGDHKALKKVTKEILKKMPAIDGIISNAGMAYPKKFSDTTIEEFEDINRVKYLGAVYLVKELYPFLTPGGFVSFTSSVAGYLGVFGYSSYVGPNFALVGLAETLMQEFVEKNIYVSVLCPPDTATPGYENEEKTKPLETKKLSGKVRLMSPGDVARVYVKKLKKGKFIILVNLDSRFVYVLKRLMPVYTVRIMTAMVKKIQRKIKSVI